jgi:hypothetical protein
MPGIVAGRSSDRVKRGYDGALFLLLCIVRILTHGITLQTSIILAQMRIRMYVRHASEYGRANVSSQISATTGDRLLFIASAEATKVYARLSLPLGLLTPFITH